MTARDTPCGEASACLDPDVCDWLYDGGDSSTGIEAAWVCQVCGNVDIKREPPSDY